MNLNEDFLSIQGILIAAEKSGGPLHKIKYRGGNEKPILNVIAALYKFLSSKKYIIDHEINDSFSDHLKEICLFLILNTEFKEALNDPNLQHLIHIAPPLSTCLLSNIIIGLDLSRQYCEALMQFDFNIQEQLLSEMVPCLKKCKMKDHVANAHHFLKLVLLKIQSCSGPEEGIEKLTEHAAQMLLNLTGLHGDQIENVRIDSVYECMGRSLLNLLDLLLISNERHEPLEPLLQKMIKTCCSIMMAVTIDVFCCWAELEHEGEVLQMLIAGKSYLFIEKFQKKPYAKELIRMLGTIAQKPKSVRDQIHSADTTTMITMVNKADTNQKNWFTALLNTQVFTNKESTECVERWAHLCTVGDVNRLLNLCMNTKDVAAKRVVVKCAATLPYEELVLVTTRHFHQNGITSNLNGNVGQELTVLFNKIKDRVIGDDFSKELYLLLLQNPGQTLEYVVSECAKNTFYSCNLDTFWPSIKEIITINDIGISILKKEIGENGPCDQNCKNYVQLFNALIKAHVFSTQTLTLEVILPLLQDAAGSQNYSLVKGGLEILKDLQGSIVLTSQTECLFISLLDVMKTCRCNFLNFDGLKQEVVRLCVDIIEKYSEMNRNVCHQSQDIKSEDFFVRFYKGRLFEQKCESDVLAHFFPINFQNHAEAVAHLIKVLPLCVTPEWTLLTTSLLDSCGVEKTVELFCDTVILLCELVNSQESKTAEVKCMFLGLGYCLQNLAVVIKQCVQPKISNLQEDVATTKNVCRLLSEIPSGNLKSEEGLNLASLLSEFSLKSLRPDKKFACLVASIHESRICKMLAEKILS